MNVPCTLQYACKLCEAAVILTAIDTFFYWAVLSLMAISKLNLGQLVVILL